MGILYNPRLLITNISRYQHELNFICMSPSCSMNNFCLCIRTPFGVSFYHYCFIFMFTNKLTQGNVENVCYNFNKGEVER